MTRDDIVRMAREAGWTGPEENVTYVAMLERFAKLIAAEIMPKETLAEMFEWGKDAGRREEREACAAVCDKLGDEYADANPADCAFAIRDLKAVIREEV